MLVRSILLFTPEVPSPDEKRGLGVGLATPPGKYDLLTETMTIRIAANDQRERGGRERKKQSNQNPQRNCLVEFFNPRSSQELEQRMWDGNVCTGSYRDEQGQSWSHNSLLPILSSDWRWNHKIIVIVKCLAQELQIKRNANNLETRFNVIHNVPCSSKVHLLKGPFPYIVKPFTLTQATPSCSFIPAIVTFGGSAACE